MTALKTLTKATNDAKLLETIKSRVKKLYSLRAQGNFVKSLLYSDVYAWCEVRVIKGKTSSIMAAQDQLSKTLRIKMQTIQGWYYAGKFMRDHKLDPESVNAVSVARAKNCASTVSKATLLKVVDGIRRRADPGKVGKLITSDHKRSGHQAVKRARRLRKDGEWNKTHLKMEMMVVQGLLSEFFKTKVSLVAKNSKGQTILEVRSK
ncbi:MAG: hypothetical protein ACXABY_25505 [Candidatus Thorarchaeota archaeon]|jgi:hypothetical protein